MATLSQGPGVRRIVHVRANIGTRCEDCDLFLESGRLAETVNHYLESHGYTLLHVGTETSHGSDGSPWHATAAVLGKQATAPEAVRDYPPAEYYTNPGGRL